MLGMGSKKPSCLVGKADFTLYSTVYRSLGITALEMAEGKAPYGEIHPMRAMFMIPTKPPPSFSNPDKWSSNFIEFVSRCLVKNPEERATASELLEHDFIRNSKPSETLREMIAEAQEIKEKLQASNVPVGGPDYYFSLYIPSLS